MNAQCRDTELGGQLGERGGPGDVEGDQEHRRDGDSVEMDVEWCRTDGATSGTQHNLKRVGSRLPAGVEVSQHKQHKHETAYTPEPSRPPPEHHR